MFSIVSRWNGFLHAPSLEVDSGTLLMETISLHLKGFKSVLLLSMTLKLFRNKYHANSKTKIILFLNEKVNDLIQEHSPEKTAENWAN